MAEDTYFKKGAYENFYLGSYTPFEPDFGEYFTGYRMPSEQLGAPTSPQTADQLRQATKLLNTGMKVVEVGAIQPQVFESIPKQRFKELRRQAELTGTEVTVHGPIVDMAGFTEQGWQEEERKRAEKQIIDTLEKAHQINPQGKIPVTFHGGNPIQRWRYLSRDEREKLLKEYPDSPPEVKKEIESGKIRDYMVAVNPETGQIQGLRYEERVWPEGKMIFDPKRRVDMINKTQWDNDKFELAVLEEQKARLASLIPPEEYGRLKEKVSQGRVTKEDIDKLQQLEAPLHESNYREYMKIRDMYDDVMHYGDKNVKNFLQNEAGKIIKQVKEGKKSLLSDEVVSNLRNIIMQIPTEMAPKKWKPGDEFAQEKVAETAANAAFKAWKKYGSKAPTLALENFPGSVMSTGEESVKVVEKARKEFIKIAEKKGVAPETARVAAQRLIGLTWDLGHINLMRKQGFPKEFVTEETKKAAKYIQKLHLTDNFGFEDAHLPPGMGNVPFKEALEEIKKQGVKVPNIVEAGGFAQQFKTSPHPYVLEALGSPLYTYMAEPYWNQIKSSYASYFQGYGEFLPDFHFRVYGSPSFSALPTELGGELPGERRQSFSGQGME